MLALIDSTWKFMLVWNGTALGSILLNEIYDLADIHFLQFIAYISASLSIRFQPFFSCDGAGIHTSRLLQSGLTSNKHLKIASIGSHLLDLRISVSIVNTEVHFGFTTLCSILLNQIYNLADIHCLQFIGYISNIFLM